MGWGCCPVSGGNTGVDANDDPPPSEEDDPATLAPTPATPTRGRALMMDDGAAFTFNGTLSTLPAPPDRRRRLFGGYETYDCSTEIGIIFGGITSTCPEFNATCVGEVCTFVETGTLTEFEVCPAVFMSARFPASLGNCSATFPIINQNMDRGMMIDVEQFKDDGNGSTTPFDALVDDRLFPVTPPVPEVEQWILVDAVADIELFAIDDGATIALDTLGVAAEDLNIRVVTAPNDVFTSKVQIFVNGTFFGTEFFAPFAVFRDFPPGDFDSMTQLAVGMWNVTAVPFGLDNATGVNETISFEIVATLGM